MTINVKTKGLQSVRMALPITADAQIQIVVRKDVPLITPFMIDATIITL